MREAVEDIAREISEKRCAAGLSPPPHWWAESRLHWCATIHFLSLDCSFVSSRFFISLSLLFFCPFVPSYSGAWPFPSSFRLLLLFDERLYQFCIFSCRYGPKPKDDHSRWNIQWHRFSCAWRWQWCFIFKNHLFLCSLRNHKETNVDDICLIFTPILANFHIFIRSPAFEWECASLIASRQPYYLVIIPLNLKRAAPPVTAPLLYWHRSASLGKFVDMIHLLPTEFSRFLFLDRGSMTFQSSALMFIFPSSYECTLAIRMNDDVRQGWNRKNNADSRTAPNRSSL